VKRTLRHPRPFQRPNSLADLRGETLLDSVQRTGAHAQCPRALEGRLVRSSNPKWAAGAAAGHLSSSEPSSTPWSSTLPAGTVPRAVIILPAGGPGRLSWSGASFSTALTCSMLRMCGSVRANTSRVDTHCLESPPSRHDHRLALQSLFHEADLGKYDWANVGSPREKYAGLRLSLPDSSRWARDSLGPQNGKRGACGAPQFQ
jgi:hypothetical protein